jgi:hypothetical protein
MNSVEEVRSGVIQADSTIIGPCNMCLWRVARYQRAEVSLHVKVAGGPLDHV